MLRKVSFVIDSSGMWIDINTQNEQQNTGHWIPAEGEKVRSLLNRLHKKDVSKDNIFLITPFRDVAEKLTELFPEHEKNIGTIHTFQGKEADVVILVLGGDPSKPGAKIWASKRPNLLNVAVSRAKRCLIVVGSKKLWSGYPYFDVCSKHLHS
jgi:superfamily I DNA and/or RNA helicase